MSYQTVSKWWLCVSNTQWKVFSTYILFCPLFSSPFHIVRAEESPQGAEIRILVSTVKQQRVFCQPLKYLLFSTLQCLPCQYLKEIPHSSKVAKYKQILSKVNDIYLTILDFYLDWYWFSVDSAQSLRFVACIIKLPVFMGIYKSFS